MFFSFHFTGENTEAQRERVMDQLVSGEPPASTQESDLRHSQGLKVYAHFTGCQVIGLQRLLILGQVY